MSADNSITRGGREPGGEVEPNEATLPDEVRSRYDVRIVEVPGSNEVRVGLFSAGNRETPAIEIIGDRIVARREDAETVDSLVRIAKHNGWDGIDVDGSPDFRKAVWTAASREGLAVNGYEPSFTEQEQLAKLRREDAERRERDAVAAPAVAARDPDATIPHTPAGRVDGPAQTDVSADRAGAVERGSAALAEMAPLLEERRTLRAQFDRSSELADEKFSDLIDAQMKNEDTLREKWGTVLKSPDYARRLEADGYSLDVVESLGRRGRWQEDIEGLVTRLREPEPAPQLSDADSRLLLKVSALTEDKKALYGNLREDMDQLTRDVQFERIDVNREALNNALEQALESPGVVKAFERAGYEPDNLREFGRGGLWEEEVADAIYLARSGRHRETLEQETQSRSILADEIKADREDREVAESTVADRRHSSGEEPPLVREEQEQDAAYERRHEGDELADLFLHGAAERVAGDPRLAGAVQAQAAMEQHIGEVFGGDVTRITSANQESRQMISDALRRGLDVSVREPTPVRQIEPIQTRPDLER